MAIDTENKRRSVLSLYGFRILPVADGAITQPDWQHVGKVYRGIIAAAPAIAGAILEVAMAEMFTQVALETDAEAFCADMFGHASTFEGE